MYYFDFQVFDSSMLKESFNILFVFVPIRSGGMEVVMLNEIVCSSLSDLPVHIGFLKNRDSGTKCSLHFHDEIELLALLSGRMTCSAGEETVEFSAGDVVFINSCVPHDTEILEKDTNCILLQINTDAFADDSISKYFVNFVNSKDIQMALMKADDPETKELFDNIKGVQDEYQRRDGAYERYIKARVFLVLAFLYRHNLLIDAAGSLDVKMLGKIMPVLAYVEENYSQPITLGSISRVLNLNQQYFCRFFKRATNRTFVEYLNYVRICKAEAQLFSTAKTITEISLESGFSSVSFFNRTFKKLKMCSPSLYRKIRCTPKR